MSVSVNTSDKTVRHFRQILLWPVQLMPIRKDAPIQKHWELLQKFEPDNPWKELADEFTGDPRLFQERHYSEFVTFLPHIQRFLYGEGKGTGSAIHQESSIRVFRRSDVARVRITYPDPHAAPVTFQVAHVDLYFFYDIDVAILVVEVYADDLPLSQAQNALFRFGRCYPTYWEPDGHGGHCPKQVEWLSAEDKVLAVSDYENREKYLALACRYRAPSLASHWEFLLEPLVLHHSGKKGLLRYRQIEYHLMPLMAYLVMDNPGALIREEFVRLGLATAPGAPASLPYSDSYLHDFEERYCYDRYWNGEGQERPGTRFMCTGRVFTMVGDCGERVFVDRKTDLEQFRHEYFLLFLIPHFHKAALLMLADCLVDAMNNLDITKRDSVRQFRARHSSHVRRLFALQPPLLVASGLGSRASEGTVSNDQRPSRHGSPLCRARVRARRHESVSRQRGAAPAGRDNGAPHRGGHDGLDRSGVDWFLGDEPVCGHRRAAPDTVLLFFDYHDSGHRPDLLHDVEIQAAIRLSGNACR